MRLDAKMQGRFILIVALTLSLCFPVLSSADADKEQQCVDVADHMQIYYTVVL